MVDYSKWDNIVDSSDDERDVAREKERPLLRQVDAPKAGIPEPPTDALPAHTLKSDPLDDGMPIPEPMSKRPDDVADEPAAPLAAVGGDVGNGDCVARPATARVVVLHRAGDTGPGAQVEFNNAFAWDGQFDEFLGARGCEVVYPTSAAVSKLKVGATHYGPATVDKACGDAYGQIRKALEDGIEPERVFVGGFDGGGAVALHLATRSDVAIGGYFSLFGGRGMGKSEAIFEGLRTLEARGVEPPRVALGLEAPRLPLLEEAPRDADGAPSLGYAESKDDADAPASPELVEPPPAEASAEARLAELIESVGGAADSWTADAPPEDDGEVSGAVNVSTQVEKLAGWLAARLPGPGEAAAPPAPRKQAKPDMVDRFKVTYARKELPGGTHRLTFFVPEGCEQLLEKYPINCRGSAFEVRAAGKGRVATEIWSPEPDATAAAIAARLTTRLKDPSSAGAEACALM